ncbi:uncharacterized protein LOC115096075 [Rhinatrema bivittatum]|uniref:uncharacterized protein LOC115096075 n=1 Tax=Rhinatrema bivittatum TaxID=194408 RepID=UPI0011273E6B|nr:uncharacterized protein LOC115096075 [Rhinatrema bivittatum]
MEKLYPLPEECLDMLKMPKMDSSVTAVTKHTTIPVVGAMALRDVQDCKLEFHLKRLFEVLALGVRALICSSLMQQASLRWLGIFILVKSRYDSAQQVPKKKVSTSVEEAIAAIKTPVPGLVKLFLVRKAREGVARREHSRALTVKAGDVFKSAYWALAQHMLDEGFLPDEDLLFFLTHSEIGEVLQQRPPALILRYLMRSQLSSTSRLSFFFAWWFLSAQRKSESASVEL